MYFLKEINRTEHDLDTMAELLEANNINQHNMNLLNMNNDCLIGIFDLLDVETLYILCFVSKKIRRIIVEEVIGRKLIDFVSLGRRYSIIALLEMFGDTMTRIKVCGSFIQCRDPTLSHFEEFLSLLIRYGGKRNLIEVDFTFYVPMILNQRLLTDSIEYFQNIETFCFCGGLKSEISGIDEFFTVFPFTNVRTLCLRNIVTIGNWLRSNAILSVKHLQISNVFYDEENLRFFLARANGLKVFTFTPGQSRDPYQMLRMVVQNVPNIDEIHETRDLYLVTGNNDRRYMKDLESLKKLSITSYHSGCHDLYEIINSLAKTNTLTSLSLSFPSSSVQMATVTGGLIDSTIWKKFTNLTVLGLSNCPKECLTILCKNVANLQEIHFNNYKYQYQLTQADIEIVLKNVPKLSLLKVLSRITFSSRFYLKLLGIKKRLLKVQNVHEPYPLIIQISTIVVERLKSELQTQYDGKIITLQPCHE